MKNIDYRFKILYALGIIMVVCGHSRGGGIALFTDWFPYSGFHLALFVFASGYFYNKTSEENSRRYLVHKVKTLILPLYAYTLLYGLIVYLSKARGFEIGENLNLYNLLIAPINDGHQFAYNMGGWIVVALFMVEIINVLIRKMLKVFKKDIPEITFFILYIILGLIGNYLASIGYFKDWWVVLVRMTYFLPFFGLGAFYKNTLEKYDRKISHFYYFVIILLIKIGIFYLYGKMPTYTPSWCSNFTEGPIMPIIIGYLGIAFWFRIATILEPVIGKSKHLNLIADNTFSIMMNQFLGFMILKTVYALLYKYGIACSDFDWVSYKTDIWWYYIPKGLDSLMILYAISGIAFPIAFQKIISLIKNNLTIVKT